MVPRRGEAGRDPQALWMDTGILNSLSFVRRGVWSRMSRCCIMRRSGTINTGNKEAQQGSTIMATPCPTTSFNTTSAASTSRTMATTALTSINSSAEDCVEEGGRNTSTLVGDEVGCQSTKHTPPPISSQIKPKRNMESASLSDSSISATSSSSRCAKKSKTSNGRLQVPTENHLKLRKAIDAGETWEFDLEQVHGLTDEEACVCVSIVTKHLHDESFPPSN